MSKTAEEKALEAYPVVIEHLHYLDWIEANGGKAELDINAMPRIYFNQGYEKAEEDLALTWEDMKLIHEISEDFWEPKWCDDKDKEKAGYEKVLRKFNKRRNR